MRFKDRFEAGAVLSERLQNYAGASDTVVVALPRGGVPVAYVIAERLRLPTDIFFVKKIPSPYNPEAAIGAVSENERLFLNERAVAMLRIDKRYIEEQKAKILVSMRQKRALYGKRRGDIRGKRVILTDDGIATGASAYLAAKALKEEGAKEVIVAVPVAPRESFALLQETAEKIVAAHIPDDFTAVGQFYEDFHQLDDDEVKVLLNKA